MTLPRLVAMKFAGQECSHARRDCRGRLRVEEKRARPPRQNVFHGSRHFRSCRPDNFCSAIDQRRMQRLAQAGFVANEVLNSDAVRSIA